MYPIKTKKSYDPNNLALAANIYTTVYLGNYINWDFRENIGSHCWVDIIPQVKNDSVFACLSWMVTMASNNASEGNFVVIKHDGVPDFESSSTTTLYSCYMHMSSLNVKTWDSVNEWTIIWQTWNTGNSTGEHLHFQLDRANAPFHPYWPFTFKDSQKAWLGFFEATNKGLGLDNGKKYTINPLLYLDTLQYKWLETTSMLIASTSNITSPAYFSDVCSDNNAVNYLAQEWITKWYPDGTFRWENNISRIEILAMTFTFAKTQIDSILSSDFLDVQASDWFCKYVMTAKAHGMVSGYPDGTFRPNNPVTRIEALAIILNTVLWRENISNITGSLFDDIESGSWYEKYVYYSVNNGIFNITWGQFFPNLSVKRSEVAEILYNLRDKIK